MMQYAPINAVLVEAMKELDNTNKQLAEKNSKLEMEINQIKEILKRLENK